jgi:hypothetical protein
MTAKSFFESRHGINKQTMTLHEIWKEMEEYVDHRWQEFKTRKETFNSERWQAQTNFEEVRKRLGKDKTNENH